MLKIFQIPRASYWRLIVENEVKLQVRAKRALIEAELTDWVDTLPKIAGVRPVVRFSWK